MSNTNILTKNGSPEVSATVVTDKTQISAYGLGDGDCITFLKIQYDADKKTYTRNGCSVIPPSELNISRATDYMIGTCKPSITKCRNNIIINKPGIYLPVLKNVSATDVEIEAQQLDASCTPSPAELGIEPCGCNCDDTKTGKSECRDHHVWEEYKQADGQLVWKDSGTKCGYDPTEPLYITDESTCGSNIIKIVYMYGEGDEADPDATVSITDCSGKIIGKIYPTTGPGHTIPVKSCGLNGLRTIGYASNQSKLAPQLMAQPDAINGHMCDNSIKNNKGDCSCKEADNNPMLNICPCNELKEELSKLQEKVKAIYEALDKKANTEEVNESLNSKANKTDLDAKANKEDLANTVTTLETKADKSALDNKADRTELETKANKAEVETKLAELNSAITELKAKETPVTDVSGKADKSDVDSADKALSDRIKVLEDRVPADDSIKADRTDVDALKEKVTTLEEKTKVLDTLEDIQDSDGSVSFRAFPKQ